MQRRLPFFITTKQELKNLSYTRNSTWLTLGKDPLQKVIEIHMKTLLSIIELQLFLAGE